MRIYFANPFLGFSLGASVTGTATSGIVSYKSFFLYIYRYTVINHVTAQTNVFQIIKRPHQYVLKTIAIDTIRSILASYLPSFVEREEVIQRELDDL